MMTVSRTKIVHVLREHDIRTDTQNGYRIPASAHELPTVLCQHAQRQPFAQGYESEAMKHYSKMYSGKK